MAATTITPTKDNADFITICLADKEISMPCERVIAQAREHGCLEMFDREPEQILATDARFAKVSDSQFVRLRTMAKAEKRREIERAHDAEDIETQAEMQATWDAEAAQAQTNDEAQGEMQAQSATNEPPPPPADKGKPVGSGAKVRTRKLSREETMTRIKNSNHGNVYNFDDVKQQVTIKQYLQDRGFEICGNKFNATWRGGDSFKCSFVEAKKVWCDHKDGGKGGSVIDLCMRVEGLSTAKEAATVLGDRYHLTPKSGGGSSLKQPREVAQYVYSDENGNWSAD